MTDETERSLVPVHEAHDVYEEIIRRTGWSREKAKNYLFWYVYGKKLQTVKPSNRVDVSSPTANMFGVEPCPMCGSKFRVPTNRPDGSVLIVCDCPFREVADCGLST